MFDGDYIVPVTKTPPKKILLNVCFDEIAPFGHLQLLSRAVVALLTGIAEIEVSLLSEHPCPGCLPGRGGPKPWE